jgi:hypothetical protein
VCFDTGAIGRIELGEAVPHFAWGKPAGKRKKMIYICWVNLKLHIDPHRYFA